MIRLLYIFVYLLFTASSCSVKSEQFPLVVATPVPSPINPEVPVQALSSFVLAVMTTCKVTSLSEGKRLMLAGQIARIAEKQLTYRTHQEAFVLLICIESKFNNMARSHVGAVGLTQIMPKYANDFARDCKLGEFKAEELMDTEINLTIGACNFQALLDKFAGNVTLALSGYNSGPDSPTTKGLQKIKDGHAETGWYIAKYAYLREVMTSEKEVGKIETRVQLGLHCGRCDSKIFSDYTHDFKSCKCGACFVDGGLDYFRYGYDNKDDIKTIERTIQIRITSNRPKTVTGPDNHEYIAPVNNKSAQRSGGKEGGPKRVANSNETKKQTNNRPSRPTADKKLRRSKAKRISR